MNNVADCTAEDTAKRFQAYLRKYENDEKLVVLKAVNQPGVKFGQSYTSKLIRIEVTGTRGDGSPYIKNFIWKLIRSKKVISCLNIPKFFQMEEYMYCKILPILGPYGPACIHHDKQNIIMEDLAEKGYVNRFKQCFLDLNHVIFTLKMLAKFHASSLALKINNPRRFDEIVAPIQEVIYVDGEILTRDICIKFVEWIVNNLEYIKPQTQALQTIASIFTSCKHNIFENFVQLFSEPKQNYSTICHGDTWLNNMLYLYDDDNKLIDMKFVDYQTPRYASVAFDIHHFIYSSVPLSLIENSYESLIKIYHSALLKELRQLHVSEVVLAELGEEWLEEGLKIYAFFGLFTANWIVHALLASDEEFKMYEKMECIYFNVDIVKSHRERFDRINCIVSHYYNRYHLGIIRDDLEPLPVTE